MDKVVCGKLCVCEIDYVTLNVILNMKRPFFEHAKSVTPDEAICKFHDNLIRTEVVILLRRSNIDFCQHYMVNTWKWQVCFLTCVRVHAFPAIFMKTRPKLKHSFK